MSAPTEAKQTLRRRLHRALDPAIRNGGLSKTNAFLCLVIVLSLAVALIETEPTVSKGREHLFRLAELGFGAIFAAEYVARFWAAAERATDGRIWRARLAWMVSPMAIVDLVSFLPTLILVGSPPTFLLRLARFLRILRLAKLGRFSGAWRFIAQVVHSRRYELGLTFFAALMLMIISATALFLAEGEAQPDKFGSIPRAMWWSVVTLTTIGYGDVFPTTPLGKMIASFTAFIGIGLIAAPTGILAGAFSEAHRRQADEKEGDDG